MELTQVKNGLFGYKKTDVVRYISELNELHNAQISAKSEEYAELKGKSDKEIDTLKAQNKSLEEKIASLEASMSKLRAEFDASIASCNAITKDYNALMEETKELRDKSDIISTVSHCDNILCRNGNLFREATNSITFLCRTRNDLDIRLLRSCYVQTELRKLFYTRAHLLIVSEKHRKHFNVSRL